MISRNFSNTSIQTAPMARALLLGRDSKAEGAREMLTCVIQYQIDPTQKQNFARYAQNWNTAIPRCGANLIGYYTPHEGSSTLAYGIYDVESLAEYEAYRARLAQDPLGRENYEFAQREKFILREERTWLKKVQMPAGE